MICLMCRKDLEYAISVGENHQPSRSDAINDGGTVEISFGYGSRLDCQMALGYICDGCFDGNRHLFVNHYDGLKREDIPKGNEKVDEG